MKHALSDGQKRGRVRQDRKKKTTKRRKEKVMGRYRKRRVEKGCGRLMAPPGYKLTNFSHLLSSPRMRGKERRGEDEARSGGGVREEEKWGKKLDKGNGMKTKQKVDREKGGEKR